MINKMRMAAFVMALVLLLICGIAMADTTLNTTEGDSAAVPVNVTIDKCWAFKIPSTITASAESGLSEFSIEPVYIHIGNDDNITAGTGRMINDNKLSITLKLDGDENTSVTLTSSTVNSSGGTFRSGSAEKLTLIEAGTTFEVKAGTGLNASFIPSGTYKGTIGVNFVLMAPPTPDGPDPEPGPN